ncbi:hypothetical protein [Mycobacterium europaeum]|uniref:hypothetical protein n=1 Tax=Mycobacterium europaeum TaxID=761804 RepID=UPI00114DE5FA|nr:hypothetical protein [Mycobacterium europaeum]
MRATLRRSKTQCSSSFSTVGRIGDLEVVKILEPVLAPGALILGYNVNLDPNHGYLNDIHAPATVTSLPRYPSTRQ